MAPPPPRLALRFAAYAGVALLLAAAAGSLITRQHALGAAKEESWSEARFVADRLGRDDLARSAVERPAYGDLRAQLDDVFGRDALGPGIERVTVYGRDGRVTYSSEHRLIGTEPRDPQAVAAALAGERVSEVRDGVLESYVQLHWLLADPTFPAGVLAVARDYDPVAREARDDFLSGVVAITLALLVLYGASFPILRRVTRTLAQRNRELAESESRYRALTEQASDAIVVCDRDGQLLEANLQAERLLGYDREQLLGMRFADLGDLDRLRADSGESVLQERRLVRADGEVVVGEVHAKLLEDGRLLASIRDVTQLRKAQRAEAVGRLAGGTAHDFNNLLMGIGGHADFLLERLPVDDPLRRHAEEIRKVTARGSSLTRQLLAFSRRQIVRPELLDLNAVVAQAEKMLGRLIGEDVELVVRPADEPALVQADPGQVEQLLVDLVLDACAALPRGGRITIAVGARDGVSLAVEHGGDASGFDAARLEAAAAQLGGSAALGDRLVRISLPRAHAAAEPFAAAAAPEPEARGETILVVEDEELVRAVIREILEDAGYTVLGARHGRQAVELCERHEGPIDLLLTDIVMPELGGRELAQQVARLHPETRVVFMSGYPDDAVVDDGVLEADVAFLQKPFTHAVLVRRVREALDAPLAAAA